MKLELIQLKRSLSLWAKKTRVGAARAKVGFQLKKPSVSSDKTLVVNEGDIVTEPEHLTELIKAIFKQETLDGKASALLDEAYEEFKSKTISFNEVVGFLKKSVTHKSKQDPSWSLILEMLEKHEKMTTANQNAYTPAAYKNSSAVFWPDPTFKDKRSLFTELPYARKFNMIDRKASIGSAGSCFAMEIALRLQRDGYNYMIAEKDPYPKEPQFSKSCARWGTIFNTPSFRQLIEKAFGERHLPKLLWSTGGQLMDPFREDVIFNSVEEYEKDIETHLAACQEALSTCDYFVLTLGVNEVWRLKSDGSVFSRAPWRISSHLVEHKVMTVEENLSELEQMLSIWRKYNPKVQLIVTVSPVPLHATFRADEHHVITANAHSKATLRVTAEEFCKRNEGVYYFPSYESVMYCTENAWEADQRHVSRNAVDKVMKLFETMFLK